mgnify:CR=1 FL=1
MAKRPKQTSPVNDPHAERESSQYDHPIASREHLLSLIEQQGPLTRRQILNQLAIKGQQGREALRRRLKAMERDGQLTFRKHDECFYIPDPNAMLSGKIDAHRDGYGFLLLADQEDIYLNEREMRQVFHGDEVLVTPIGRSRRGGIEGKIEKVVSRAYSHIVGRINREAQGYFVVPDNPRIGQDILLPNGVDGFDVDIGDYVTVAIEQYPTIHRAAQGVIDEVLGSALAPGLEIDLAIRSFDIPHQWSEASLAQANALADEPEEQDKIHRVDLRELPLVTIDGEDARDFDDAVYCETQADGGFRLWVAIADVSHYVPVDSALDQQAYERATSVYFSGRVVPMLPEAISNGLCSLKPEVDRLCMVCELDINASGEVRQQQFYEAVMHSHARLTYNEVAEALGLVDKSPRAGLMQRLERLTPHLQSLKALFLCLREARVKRGAIDFETTETQIIFNADRKIETIEPIVRNDAHKIIEECMLCANVAAANFLDSQDRSVLFRVHAPPKEQKLENLRLYLGELGLSLGGALKPEPQHYQALMQQIKGRDDAHLIQVMLLRSMNQAMYQPDNEGHFGLAYPAYLHFTSPIRRYPDLLVHRAIRSIVRSRKACDQVRRVAGAKAIAKKHIYPYDEAQMVTAGLHTSMAERRADDATRDVMAWLKCEYLQERLGDQLSGVITAVTRFGVFVELDGLFVEGLVHINSLGQDYFRYDQAQQRLVGERTQAAYRLGDKLQVIVVRVDLDERKVDLELKDSQSPQRTRVIKKSHSEKKPSAKRSGPKKSASKGRAKKTDSGRSAKHKRASKSRSTAESSAKHPAKSNTQAAAKRQVKKKTKKR